MSSTITVAVKFITGPKNVDGVKDLKVVASLQNTGDETLKILKDPRGVLSTLPTETFGITDVQGVTPSFKGVKVKFVPEHAAKLEDSFAILEPGQSIEVEHNREYLTSFELGDGHGANHLYIQTVSSAYNFTLPGEGLYDIHADNLFQIVDPTTKKLTELRANQQTSLQANIKGELVLDLGFELDLNKTVPEKLEKKATYKSCSSTRQSKIDEAATAAHNYASSASSYLNSLSSGSSRYTTWFGTYTTSRKNTVANNFDAIKGYSFHGETYDCSCTKPNVFAYVEGKSPLSLHLYHSNLNLFSYTVGNYGVIHLCGAFWDAPVTGTDSQAGTLVHEVSHFKRIAGTDDIVYGQSDARSLASSKPGQAVQNADNYEFFAENDPALS
ncbi:hypothetical protein VNI00_011034 [Paramarasmius palmivorus]|uniref:Lysine-specific metallo-endopeptidase domain-containing protein n=1 Tax=Paramarasmius palmivorus TaxID=297713 RepID=A0AAW0CER6_9AGAR